MQQRILTVDDDPQIVRLLRASLEQAGYQVFVAYDGETALHILRRERPDLVVLDLMLPDRDGWDVARVMRSDPTLADTPIIMLTARVEHHDRITGLELGADDYVTKPFHPGELLARIRAVLRRSQRGPAASSVIQEGDLVIDVGARRVEVRGETVPLTPTEFGLLRALAEHRGQALTRSELIEKGLGYSYEGIERTVDSHIRNLRRKLGDAGAPEDLIETVFGVGYRVPLSRGPTGGGDS
jgi:two-component system alkaline phosphatase synthesis response regulator PhoP